MPTAKASTFPAAARPLLKKLKASASTARLAFTMEFHAPKQGRFQPPPYRVLVDTDQTPWLAVQHYNAEPHEVALAQVRVPVEMTRFTVKVKAGSKTAVTAWAKQLLER